MVYLLIMLLTGVDAVMLLIYCSIRRRNRIIESKLNALAAAFFLHMLEDDDVDSSDMPEELKQKLCKPSNQTN